MRELIKPHVAEAIRDYKAVASLLPSSIFAARSIARCLPPQASRVVEYGAGTGAITKALLRKMAPEGTLVAVESSSRFADQLRALPDGRIQVEATDALSFARRIRSQWTDGADAVVSGIPFSFLSADDREQLVQLTAEGLRPGGRFIVYQHTRQLVPLMKRHFSQVKSRFEPRNIFPYFIIVATR